MADVTGTNGNDILFFNGQLEHLTTTLVNAYTGETIDIDDDFNVNTSSYEGLAGIDILFMTNIGDALFLANDVGVQMIANIERIIAGDGGDIINLSHETIVLNDVFIDGGRANDVLWGNIGNDTIRGFDGNDNINGGPGNDILQGQNDHDMISGGAGNDTIDGGAGIDTASYAGSPSGVVVNLLTGSASDGFGGTDSLVSIENVIGSSFNDAITGSNAANNLSGGIGNDVIAGGGGNDVITGGPGADPSLFQTITTGHDFNNTVIFPNVTEMVSIMSLVPPGDDALGIAAGDLSVDYSTTAEISFVKTVAGFNNTLGFYNISQDGTIMSVEMAFPNVKNFSAGDTATINLPGAPDTDFGFFIIANGANKNNNFSSYDLVNGEFHFVYNHNKAGERLATIHDDAKDIELVYTLGSIEKTIVGKNQTYHTTARGGDTNLNADGEIHVVSGLIEDGDTTRLRIGFEDLPNLGDADYNDVVFDITVASTSVTTLLVDDSDVLYGDAGNDTLNGGVGNDVLFGGAGADTLYGDQGSDQFVFDVMDGFVDTVMDFETGPGGDVLNITDILQGFDTLSDAISDFVQLVSNGGNTELQVNADGDIGGIFAIVAIIEGGVGGASLSDLVNSGNLVADQAPVL